MAGDEDSRVEAIRKRTKAPITHPDRVLYPAAGLTKLDVIEYYLGVAPFLLPYLHGRPITMHRFPGGVGEMGFFEKDAPAGAPEFVETFTHWAEAPGRDVDFVLCNNLDTLVWLANIASLELHATLSRAASYDSPRSPLRRHRPRAAVRLRRGDRDRPCRPGPPGGARAPAVRQDLREEGAARRRPARGRPLLLRAQGVRARGREGRRPGHPPRRLRVPAVPGEGDGLRRLPPERTREDDGRPLQPPGHPGRQRSSAPLRCEDLRRGMRPEDYTYRTVLSRTEDPWMDLFEDRQTIH